MNKFFITLTRGMVALVDEVRHEELSRYNWYATRKGRAGETYKVRMHR